MLRDFGRYNASGTMYWFRYETTTGEITSYTTPPTGFSNIIPPIGSAIYSECIGLDKTSYLYQGGIEDLLPVITAQTTSDDPSCCTIVSNDFQVQKTNNTSLITPNGTIEITSSSEVISDYEASIIDGVYVGAVDNKITFTGLTGGSYTILIKSVSGVCYVTTFIAITDVISYPPLIIREEVAPSTFSPVFSPIEYIYSLVNGQISISSDLTGTFLQVETQDGRDFFYTKPIFRILDNQYYSGVWEITGMDSLDTPTKFYFNATYVSDQTVNFVPFGQQTFYLYAEVNFNQFTKIADISASPNIEGKYSVRTEGFLQSVFNLLSPAESDDLSLGRKFYLIPSEFDLESPASINTAVYSALDDLTYYLDPLTPLSPAPINFINEQTAKGFPVIFSRLDTLSKRVSNIFSSGQPEIVSTASNINISALPGNVYDFEWINSLGPIVDYSVTPSLPSWIVKNSSASDTINLTITTFTSSGGDYQPDDYSNLDYNILTINNIVGCYEYEFFDGAASLFTLSICVYPAQGINSVCKKGRYSDVFNIAWVNKEGGWSSYVFEGKKEFNINTGQVKDFKRGNELKKSSIREVYNEVVVSFANKTIRELLFIASLRISIQAYLFNEETDKWDIPIYLNKEDFPVYTLPFKQSELNGSFSFLYSNEVKIQRQ